jgi:hypothetical protein
MGSGDVLVLADLVARRREVYERLRATDMLGLECGDTVEMERIDRVLAASIPDLIADVIARDVRIQRLRDLLTERSPACAT